MKILILVSLKKVLLNPSYTHLFTDSLLLPHDDRTDLTSLMSQIFTIWRLTENVCQFLVWKICRPSIHLDIMFRNCPLPLFWQERVWIGSRKRAHARSTLLYPLVRQLSLSSSKALLQGYVWGPQELFLLGLWVISATPLWQFLSQNICLGSKDAIGHLQWTGS